MWFKNSFVYRITYKLCSRITCQLKQLVLLPLGQIIISMSTPLKTSVWRPPRISSVLSAANSFTWRPPRRSAVDRAIDHQYGCCSEETTVWRPPRRGCLLYPWPQVSQQPKEHRRQAPDREKQVSKQQRNPEGERQVQDHKHHKPIYFDTIRTQFSHHRKPWIHQYT